MSKIFVTGGAGYIGSVLVPRLLDSGHEVTIFDNFMYGADPILSFAHSPRLSIVEGDVRDKRTITGALRDHEYVLHLAAIVGYPACAADPQRANSTNVEGTRNIALGLAPSQKLVFASTGSTYGKVEGICTEETPIAPLTLYGSNKREAEEIFLDNVENVVILRFATVFGVSPRLRLDLLINDFVYQAVHNRQIVLFEGHFRRTFLHCRDAANAFLFAVGRFDEMNRQVYNVGSSDMNFTKREVAEKIRKHVNYYLHEADVGSDPDRRDYEVSYEKIRKLGYEKTVDIDAGIEELVKVLKVVHLRTPWRNV